MDRWNGKRFLDIFGVILQVYREKIEGKGEDAYVSLVNETGALIGCFDGCGGIGSRRYAVFDTHTGAYVASRIAAQASADWFLRGCEEGRPSDLSEKELAEGILAALKSCRGMEPSSSVLKGSLTREFPTTLAMAAADTQNVVFYWAGDSRGYILDERGLHQMTTDDVEQQDAMKNLSEDGPLKNVISASRSFQIHRRERMLPGTGIVLTCTDGCFGYLSSPMAFELLLIETMQKAQNPRHWELLLKERIEKNAGDDYTLMAMVLGFDTFEQMKQYFRGRYREMDSRFQEMISQEKLLAWWEEYKKEYENY